MADRYPRVKRETERRDGNRLLELFRDLKDHAFARSLRLMGDDEKYLQLAAGDRHAKGDVDILRGFKATHEPFYLPLGAEYTNRGVNQLLSGDTPDFQFTLPRLHGPKDEATGEPTMSDTDKADLEYLRLRARALWEQVNTAKMGMPIHTSLKNGLGLGLAVLAYPLMEDRYPDPPEVSKRTKAGKEEWDAWEAQCRDVLPWDIHPVSPLNIIFDPDHDAPEYYFEFGDIARRVVKQEYPWLPISGSGPQYQGETVSGQPSGDVGQTCERVIYVSKDWWGVWVDGQPVLGDEEEADESGVAPNRAGFLWYQMSESGFGIPDSKGRLEYRLMGMIRQGRDLISAKMETFNIIQQHMLENVLWMPVISGAGPDGKQIAQDELGEQQFGPDQIVYKSDRVQLSFMETPPLPPVVLQNLEEIDKNIIAQFGPEVLSGQYRDEPASKQAQRVNQALLPFKPMEDGIEQMLAQATMDMFYSCRNILKRKVTFKGRAGSYDLDPKRVPLGLKCKCTLSPMTKVMQQADWEIKADQFERGAIAKEDLMRDGAKVEDIKRTMINQKKDLLRAHPAVADAAAQLLISGIQNALTPPPQMLPGTEMAAPTGPGPVQGQLPGMEPALAGAPPVNGAGPVQALPVGAARGGLPPLPPMMGA